MGKRIENAKKEIEANKIYSVEEAIGLAKKTATTKFIGNIEVHIRLGIDPKKTEQTVRGTVSLPHGTGKTKRIGAFVTEAKEKEAVAAGAAVVGGDELIKSIKETEKIDFEIAVAEPAMMPKLAQIAKILGPRGLMPNPKTGTVSADVGKIIKEYAAGKTEFKNDDSGNLHMTIGKTNFDEKQLAENFKAFLDAVKACKPTETKKEFIQGLTVHSTMGPAIKVKA
ncbi:MAG: 50S ribosomal protein L1 [Candidatus Doudnabacteria bacterium]|nr:50S ribosomal protein L1 [Candidatus Doudnabacteria bacterium]